MASTRPALPVGIEDLAPELLIAIFGLYILPQAARIGTHARVQLGPLLLCSVCSRWRAVCMSAPELWKSLIAAPRRRYPNGAASEAGFFELLQNWLARSGQLAVDLTVTRLSTPWLNAQILSLVPAHSKHLRKLVLHLPQQFTGFGDSLDVPLLEDLSVVAPKQLRRDGAICAFSNAPRLRRLTLKGLSLHDIALPWHQVIDLELGDLLAVAVKEILVSTPGLNRLSVFKPVRGFPPVDDLVVLPNLQTLRLLQGCRVSLLSYVLLPRLTTLEIHSTHLDNEAIAHLVACAYVSRWALRFLRFKRTSMEGYISLAILLQARPCATLEYLEFAHTLRRDTDSLVAWLQQLANDAAYLPLLKVLIIDQHPVPFPKRSSRI